LRFWRGRHPKEIIAKLNAEVLKAVADPESRQTRNLGFYGARQFSRECETLTRDHSPNTRA